MSLNNQTPLSKLANRLGIRWNNLPKEELVNIASDAASQRIDLLQQKLYYTVQIATSMAQELQEIIGDAEDTGNESPLPGTQALVDEWEHIFQHESLISEAAGNSKILIDRELLQEISTFLSSPEHIRQERIVSLVLKGKTPISDFIKAVEQAM